MQPPTATLGQKLAPILLSGFFRPLNRPTAAVYVDCAERLAHAADEGGQVSFDEARLLVREVLINHPEVTLDEDEGGQFRDLHQRAAQFFNKLLEAHWIEPRRVSLDEHFILIAPPLRRLLRLLRELAEDRPAELKDFAATLRALCRDLLVEGALDPKRLSPEEMRQTLKDLLDRAGRADDQIHAVEVLIQQHEQAQRTSASPQETLQRFLVDFHAGEHMVCYDALQEAGLLPRLNEARAVVSNALYDPYTKQRLAEGLQAHLDLDPTAAYAEAERWLERLERHLAGIPVKQRVIDGRMADFARLSDARHRYQTEMRGRRPGQVKDCLEAAARQHAGQSFADLASLPGLPLLSPCVDVFFGLDSLSRPRRPRTPVNLTLETAPTAPDPESAREEIRRRNLHVLTPQRAARFIERHLPAKGARLSSQDLQLALEDDFLDLLAVLAFDRGPANRSPHSVKWRVLTDRADLGTDPERIPRDAEAGRWMERFTLERLA